MRRNYDWSHPLPFGDTVWVKKSDVEWLVKSAQQLIRSMYENGYPSANEWAAVESALISLVGNEPANTGLQSDGAKAPGCTCNAYQLENFGCRCGASKSPRS